MKKFKFLLPVALLLIVIIGFNIVKPESFSNYINLITFHKAYATSESGGDETENQAPQTDDCVYYDWNWFTNCYEWYDGTEIDCYPSDIWCVEYSCS